MTINENLSRPSLPVVSSSAPGPRRKWQDREAQEKGKKPDPPKKPAPKKEAQSRERSRSPKRDSDEGADGEKHSEADPAQPPKPQSVQDDGASNQAEASDDKALQREPASCAEAIRVGWCEVDHGGSGDCGWRALADNWAWRKDGNALSAKDSIQNGNWFRTASVRHIRSHADKYRAGIPGADVSEDAWSAFLQEGGTSAEQFKQKADEALEAYLERAVRPGHWICARLLQATADRLGTAICVWKIGEGSAGDRRFVIAPAFSRGWPKTNPKSPPLVVILRNNRYSSLRTPQEGSVPWTWLRETQALKADDLPGGAKQRDQGSVSASKGDVESEAASVSLHTLCPESAQEDRALKPHQALKASSKAPENDTAQRPPAPSEATPSLHTMAGPETLQIQNAPKRARLCSHTEASVSLRTLAPNTTAQQPQPAPGSARVSLAQEPTLDREFVVSSAAGPSVAPARRRLKFKQHPLGDEADMGHDPLTFSEKSGHRKNRVSTVKWPCPICHVVFTWTGHDKALSQKQHHMKLVHNTRLSAVGGSRSEKMKKQWQQNPLQFKTGAEATKKAMLRAKQLQDQQRHDLAHATSLGLFPCIKKTWFCRRCLARGTTRQLTEKACEPQEWCWKKSSWWLGLAGPHREALSKACGLTKQQVDEYNEKAATVVQNARVCTGERSEAITRRANATRAQWRRDEGYTVKAASLPGKLNASTQMPRLKLKTSSRGGGIRKRPAAAKSAGEGRDATAAAPALQVGPGSWERDLTQEGVEPNPGPQKEARRRRKAKRIIPTLVIWQLNIASFALRGWDLLAAAEASKVDIVVMQETRMTCDEATRLNSSLKRWTLFHQQEEPQHRRVTPEGGVAVAVRRGIPAVKAASHRCSAGQWLRIALPGLHVTSAYRRQLSYEERQPNNESLCEDLAALGKTAALTLGDWNHDPLTDPLNVQAAGARAVVCYPALLRTNEEEEQEPQDPLPAPTRWASNRCIDWGLCCNVHSSVTVLPDRTKTLM